VVTSNQSCQLVVHHSSTPERARIYKFSGFQKWLSLQSGTANMVVKSIGTHICTLAKFGHWEKVVVTR